jgi:hypothetical protein
MLCFDQLPVCACVWRVRVCVCVYVYAKMYLNVAYIIHGYKPNTPTARRVTSPIHES